MDPRLNDKLAIAEVVNNSAIWRDAGDWERFKTVWHSDSWRTATWFPGPAEKFIDVSPRRLDRTGKRLLARGQRREKHRHRWATFRAMGGAMSLQ